MPTPTRTEYIDIDGTPIPCTAWEALNLAEVFWQGPDTRGADRLLAHVAGVKAYPRYPTVSARTLLLVIYGFSDVNGVAASNVRATLQENIDYFRAHISDPIGTGDGTRTATLHLPDGSTRSGAIHVEDLHLAADGPTVMRATLDVTIPGGALA